MALAERKTIDVVDILLDPSNFRIGHQDSQRATREAIIAEQGKRLLVLAQDVVKEGFSPFDLPFVYGAPGKPGQYIMLEGNRRLVALKLLLTPALADGTELADGIKKLSNKYSKQLPTDLFCAVAPDRKSGLTWVRRKHGKGLDGAGTEDWGALARDRFDSEMGIATPNLDALDFVRARGGLSRDVADKIDSGKFPITTLGRLLGDEVVRKKIGVSLEGGKFKSESDQDWLTKVLTEMVTAIALAKFDGKKFNVRDIDEQSDREAFAEKLLGKFPKVKKTARPWVVEKDAKTIKAKAADQTKRVSHSVSSKDRKTLLPRDFKLKLPQGKVNDVYHELRTLDVAKFTNGASALLRIFFEFSVDRFMSDFGVTLKAGTKDTLFNKLKACVIHIQTIQLMTAKELKGINTELSNKDSFISPETLNAYVHNPSFSASPDNLKLTWNRLQQLVAVLWTPKS